MSLPPRATPRVVYAWIPDLQEAEQNGDAMVEIKLKPDEGYAPLYLQSETEWMAGGKHEAIAKRLQEEGRSRHQPHCAASVTTPYGGEGCSCSVPERFVQCPTCHMMTGCRILNQCAKEAMSSAPSAERVATDDATVVALRIIADGGAPYSRLPLEVLETCRNAADIIDRRTASSEGVAYADVIEHLGRLTTKDELWAYVTSAEFAEALRGVYGLPRKSSAAPAARLTATDAEHMVEAWVGAVRDQALKLGLPDDESKGSTHDWRFICEWVEKRRAAPAPRTDAQGFPILDAASWNAAIERCAEVARSYRGVQDCAREIEAAISSHAATGTQSAIGRTADCIPEGWHWVRCSPALLKLHPSGCTMFMRRPGDGTYSHDHLVPPEVVIAPDRTPRHD